jgi:hypothetical protein
LYGLAMLEFPTCSAGRCGVSGVGKIKKNPIPLGKKVFSGIFILGILLDNSNFF